VDLETYIEQNDLCKMRLARSCGIDQKTIWRILQGTCPTLSTAVAIEEYTQKRVSCKDLLEFSRKKKDKVTQYLSRDK